MPLRPDQLSMRFGYGLSPLFPPPRDADAALEGLVGPDLAQQRWPITDFTTYYETMLAYRDARRTQRRDKTEQTQAALRRVTNVLREQAVTAQRATVSRAAFSPNPIRERMVAFWADHFTAAPRDRVRKVGVPSYVEDAIRPHVAGSFSVMLRAVATHPVMMHYLDQTLSIGPGSQAGKRTGRGLNENLARELLELHTLGVGGPYTQTDVRELAELLTGFGLDQRGFVFKPHVAEPGAETVLDQRFGNDRAPKLEDVFDALDYLATHPATAAHLARKLATHFTADTPDPDLIAALTARYLETGGDLGRVTEVLLHHPATVGSFGEKAKRPMQFILSAARALAPHEQTIGRAGPRTLGSILLTPLQEMGQPWVSAPGPDGWPDSFDDWISPQGLAHRIGWAMAAPRVLRPELPDPRAFVDNALGAQAREATKLAARAAETRWEGVGLILASPEFQRC